MNCKNGALRGILAAIFLLISVAPASIAAAADSNIITEDNFEYKWTSNDSGTATITSISEPGGGTNTIARIPASVQGLTVTAIGDTAANEKKGITGVIVPDSVKTIGVAAFQNNTALESLTLNPGLEEIGVTAFNGCTALKSVDIPGSVKKIGQSAFNENTKLKSLTLNPGLKEIGTTAFNGCEALDSVSIPSTVTTIGEAAFQGCASVSSITIPSSVTSVGATAFRGCTSVSSLTIAGNPTIGAEAFSGLSQLETLVLGSTNIGDNSYGDLSNLKTLTLNDTVKTIGASAFQNATSLKSLTIPSSVTQIGENAFQGCTDLEELTINGGKTGPSIGDGAFGGPCTIKTLKLPEGVSFYGTGAAQQGRLAFFIVVKDKFIYDTIETIIYNGYRKDWDAISPKPTAFTQPDVIVRCIDDPEGISVSPAKLDLKTKGATSRLRATISPEAAKDATVKWSSDNEETATVDQKGEVTAVGNGTAIITAALTDFPDLSASCTVKVEFPAAITRIDPASTSVVKNKNVQLTAVLDPETATDTVEWSSDKPSVATVSENGLVTGVSAGDAVITAKLNGSSAKCEINVTEDKTVTGITISPEQKSLVAGETADLTVSVQPSGAEDSVESVTWTSNNEEVVTVPESTSKTITVTAVGEGDATITATATVAGEKFTATSKITVTKPAEKDSITITPPSVSLKVDEEKTLTATVTPEDATVTWETSDAKIATVENGVVKGVSAGTTTITAKNGDATATCEVTVTADSAAVVSPKGIAVSPKLLAVEKGKTSQLTAKLDPADAAGTVVWSSSDEKVATVNSKGLVTGVSAGKTTITATVQGTKISADCSVTVTDPVAKPTESPSSSPSASPSASATGSPTGSTSPGAPGGAPALPPAQTGTTAPGAPVSSPAAQPTGSAGAAPSSSASPGSADSAAPGASASAPGTSESTEPSPEVIPVPDTPSIELKPDLTDTPAEIEVVVDPENGSSILAGVPISSPSEKNDVADLTSWVEAPEGATVEVKQADGSPAPMEAAIATGMRVEVISSDGSVMQSTTVVVKGDVTGSGEMNLTQLVRMARGYTGAEPLRGVFLAAADLNGDGRVTLTDLVREARMYVAAGL